MTAFNTLSAKTHICVLNKEAVARTDCRPTLHQTKYCAILRQPATRARASARQTKTESGQNDTARHGFVHFIDQENRKYRKTKNEIRCKSMK